MKRWSGNDAGFARRPPYAAGGGSPGPDVRGRVLVGLCLAALAPGCTRGDAAEDGAAGAPAAAAPGLASTRPPTEDTPVPRGPVLTIRATPCDLPPGGVATLEASLGPRPGAAKDELAALVHPLTWTWLPPPGWKIVGEGTTVELVAPPSIEAEVEVLLRVADQAGFSMTGRARVRPLRGGP